MENVALKNEDKNFIYKKLILTAKTILLAYT